MSKFNLAKKNFELIGVILKFDLQYHKVSILQTIVVDDI